MVFPKMLKELMQSLNPKEHLPKACVIWNAKYLKEKFPNFEYRVEIDFVKKTEKINYPRVNYEHTFAEIAKTIEFNNEENIGFYFQTNKGVLYKNIVILNNKLSNFVSPLLFNNNKFGIDKIETIDRTITLKSVFYK
jgi:hypothetical protein